MSSMRVALVYNQKKEESTQQSESSSSSEPPSPRRSLSPSQVHRVENHPIVNPAADRYAEWDTFETIDAVRAALSELHDVTLIEADRSAYVKLAEMRPDFVFNIAEGFNGVSREAQIPAILEMLQIPYTGSDPLTLGICLDKSRAKEILSHYGVRTPRFTVVRDRAGLDRIDVPLPAIVKPLYEGSSKGIFNSSLVRTKFELVRQVTHITENYQEPSIVEEFLPGREFTVALVGNEPDIRVLPIVEIRFDSLPEGVNPIYSYEAKWIWDRSDHPLEIFECPAQIPGQLQAEIESMCRKAYTILGCRDWSRIDVRLDADGRPHILELNPLPGILPNPEDNSCFPKAARAAGLSYRQLMQTVLGVAAYRYGIKQPETTVRPLPS